MSGMTPDPKKDEEVLRMVRQRLSELDIEEPEEPLPQDCCGQSCKPCVFDIHRKDLHNWARDIAKTIKFGDSTIYEHVYGADDEEKKDGDEGLKTLESYKALEILEIVQMTADTMLFTFSTKGPPISIPIGSHLRARVSTNGHHMSRQYTPTSVSATSFQVPIKLYDTGKFTKLARQWTLETTVEWLGPFLPGHGDWLKKSSFLQCYAAGTGIAPFIRIIQSLLDEDVCDLRVQLVYCVRSEKDVLFKELIDKWTKHWNFTVHVVTSSPEKPTTLPYLAQVHPGSRLKEEIFHSLLTTFCNPDHDGLRLAVCGSKSFEKDVINFARRDGLPDGQIFRFPG